MRFCVFQFFLFSVLCVTSTAVQAQISLDSCQSKAKRNYPLIQQYGLIEQTEAFTISNANKNFLPQLGVQVIGGVVDGFPSFEQPGSSGSGSEWQLISVIQLTQAIWDGGVTKAKKEIARSNAEVDQAEIEVALYQLRSRVDQLFFGVLLLDSQIEQAKLFLSNLDRQGQKIEMAVENGIAFKTDLDEIRVSMLNTEEQISELNYNKKAYLKVLSVMIGEQLEDETKLLRPPLELIPAERSIGRPELLVYDQQKAMIDAQTRLNKTSLYPKVGLLGFGTFLYPGVDFGASELDRIIIGGLSVSWNIGGLYRNSNNKKLSEIGKMRIENQEETFLFNTNLLLDQNQVELEKYQESIVNSQEILQIKKKIKKAYEVKYDNGVCTMNELLDKSNEANLAAQKLILQEIQYLQKVYQYKFQSGR